MLTKADMVKLIPVIGLRPHMVVNGARNFNAQHEPEIL